MKRFAHLGAITLLLVIAGGCQQITKITDLLAGNTPGKYARLMEDSSLPDARRVGVNGLVKNDFARKPPYTSRYRQIASEDTDPLVRATAMRALNRSRDRGASAIYLKGLSDPSELVRLEAVKALVNMPDEAAVTPLQKIVNRPEESRDVRIAAADALKHYKTQEVARTLVAQLGERDFGVAWQAHRSLKKLTGRDLRYDEAAWMEYLTKPGNPLS